MYKEDKLEAGIKTIVEMFQAENPELEIHSVIVNGKYNYATKKLEYWIRADVRGKGQIFLGMSS